MRPSAQSLRCIRRAARRHTQSTNAKRDFKLVYARSSMAARILSFALLVSITATAAFTQVLQESWLDDKNCASDPQSSNKYKIGACYKVSSHGLIVDCLSKGASNVHAIQMLFDGAGCTGTYKNLTWYDGANGRCQSDPLNFYTAITCS